LQVTPGDLLGPAGVCDSWEYWGVICSHLPPMTDEQIATVGTVLRRIQRRHHGDGDQMPKAA
ncbi:MAG: hypothetical protein ACRDSE_02225, partial [Pseudonocardiaceae bacterium]